MKKKSLINCYLYLLQGFTFLMLCLNAHHFYAQEQNAQQLPTLSEMQNIECRIEGEMNPYVGEVYKYILHLSEKTTNPIQINIVTGAYGFSRIYTGKKEEKQGMPYTNNQLNTTVPADTNQIVIEVIWSEISNNSIRVGSESSQIFGTLFEINVQMHPLEWEAPDKINLNEAFTIKCNYTLLPEDAIAKWTYGLSYFQLIDNTTIEERKEAYLTLLPIRGTSSSGTTIELEMYRNIFTTLQPTVDITLGKKSITYQIEEPELSGETTIDLYETYEYTLHGNNLRNIVWTGENIKIINGQGSPKVKIVPTKAGEGNIKVTYNTGDNDLKKFSNELKLSINNVIMEIDGPDMVCSPEMFFITNFPEGAVVNWKVEKQDTHELIYSLTNQTSSSILVENSWNKEDDTIFITLEAKINYNTLVIILSRSIALVKSGIQESGYKITGSYNPDGGMFELSPRPYDATGFHWSIDNGWTANVDNQPFCDFFNMNGEPFYGSFWVTVSFLDPCGKQMVVRENFNIENRFMLSSNPVSYDLEIKDNSPLQLRRNIHEIRIFTQMGLFVMERTYPAETYNAHVDVSTLSEGNYVLQIFDGTKWEQHKVIVNR